MVEELSTGRTGPMGVAKPTLLNMKCQGRFLFPGTSQTDCVPVSKGAITKARKDKKADRPWKT